MQDNRDNQGNRKKNYPDENFERKSGRDKFSSSSYSDYEKASAEKQRSHEQTVVSAESDTDTSVSELRRLRKQREEKKARQRLAVMIIFVLIIITLVSIMINIIREESTPKPQLFITTADRLNNPVDTRVMILRDEENLYADAGGIFQEYKESGVRVKKNAPVAKILAKSAAAEREELNNIDQEISKRQLELLETESLRDNQQIKALYAEYDYDLQEYVRQLQDISQDKLDLNNSSSVENQIAISLKERSDELNEFDFNDEKLSQLREHRSELNKYLSQFETYVYASKSATVSYLIDSYNKPVDLETLYSITAEDINKADPGSDLALHGSALGKEVKTGDKVATEIYGFNQYLLIAVDPKTAGKFDLGENYDLFFPEQNFGIDACKLYAINDRDKNNIILIFATSDGISQLANLRYDRVHIDLYSQVGIKIPKKALQTKEQNNKKINSVMVLKYGYVYEQTVNVLAEDANYYLVSTPEGAKYPLEDGSIVVQNPEIVSDGQKISN